MHWNDENVETLKKLWADGFSASQVAARIGGITRNAVIGKVHRLGLTGRGHKNNKPPKRRSDPARIPRSRAMRKRVRILDVLQNLPPQTEIPVTGGVALMDLESGQCRYPITPDHATSAQHRFCGCKQALGLPYCADHAKIAYRPADPVPQRKEFKPRENPYLGYARKSAADLLNA